MYDQVGLKISGQVLSFKDGIIKTDVFKSAKNAEREFYFFA